MDIIWKEVADITNRGHGVEFFHKAQEDHSNHPVALVEKFKWLKDPTARVQVRILAPDSELLQGLSVEPEAVLDDVRSAVMKLLKRTRPKLIGNISENVFFVANA